jgi:AcrR family transcriptional regulator
LPAEPRSGAQADKPVRPAASTTGVADDNRLIAKRRDMTGPVRTVMTVPYGQNSFFCALRRDPCQGVNQKAGRRMSAVSKPGRDDRRDAILGIAREVFKEEGYAAASMSAIAARVGGSKGTLYNYFRSKSDLFGAVVQNDCERSQASLIGLTSNDDDVSKRLTTLGKAFLGLILSDEVIAFHRMVVAESARFPEIGEAHYRAGPCRGRDMLASIFTKAQIEGQLNIPDPVRAAEQIADLMLSGLYRRRLWNVGPKPTDAEIEANVEAAVSLFMAAYRVT